MALETVYTRRAFRAGVGGRAREYTPRPEKRPTTKGELANQFSRIGYSNSTELASVIHKELNELPMTFARHGRGSTSSAAPFLGQPRKGASYVPKPSDQHGATGDWSSPIPGPDEDPDAYAHGSPGAGGASRSGPGNTPAEPRDPRVQPADVSKQPQPVYPPGSPLRKDPAVKPVDTSKQPQPVYPEGRPEGVPGPTREAALYSSIRKAEGTTDEKAQAAGFESGYEVPLGYGKYGRPNKPLTEMTLKEAHEFGNQIRRHPDNPYNSSALGAFQIVGSTMKEYMDEAGLTWDDKFSAENQQKLAGIIAQKQGLGAWEGFKHHPAERRRAAEAMRAGDIVPGGGTFSGGGATATIPPNKPGTPTLGKPEHLPVPTGQAAAAVDEMLTMEGMHEDRDRADLKNYLATGQATDPARTAWCAAFVNTALARQGIKGTGSRVATSFSVWGKPVPATDVKKGDVLVQTKGRAPGQTGGHVGMATGNTRRGPGNRLEIEMASGNQADRVTRNWYPANALVVRRMPNSQASKPAETPQQIAAHNAQKTGLKE